MYLPDLGHLHITTNTLSGSQAFCPFTCYCCLFFCVRSMGWLFRCVFFPHHCLPPHDPHSPSYKPTPKGHLFTRPAHYVIINIFIDLTTSAGTQLIWWLKWWRAEIVSKGFTVGERGFGASTESRLELRSVKAFTERNKNMEPVAKKKKEEKEKKRSTH